MATADLAGFRARFPEFESELDGAVDNVLEEALYIHARLPLATLFCAAHLMQLQKDQTGGVLRAGEVAEERAGPLGATYTTQAESAIPGGGSREAFFTKTTYGQRFLNLEKRTPRTAIGAMVAG